MLGIGRMGRAMAGQHLQEKGQAESKQQQKEKTVVIVVTVIVVRENHPEI